VSRTARELLARDRVRLSHRFEYAAFRAVLAAGSLLSDDTAAAVGAALGRIGYPLGIKRKVVERNLRIAFPDADDARVQELARASFAHLGRETMMMLRLSTMSKQTLIERTCVTGKEQFSAALDAGKGAVVFSGHLGNWEIGAALMAARGYPVSVIAKRAANPLFYANILDARERLGIDVIDFQGATRHAIRALRGGRIVAFAADQHAGRAGIQVPFFGRPASTYRGPALLAMRTGAPVFLSSTLRMPDGSYELALDQIMPEPTGDIDADTRRLTAEFALRLEAAVRRNPEQYLWHHRRWR
jgi:Kdo2-lipid IVA lauroyltransferase/acyltransferase